MSAPLRRDRLVLGVLAALFLGCPPVTPPAPVPPDATDGAPTPAEDASPSPPGPPAPSTPCDVACAAMARLCGPQQPDCVRVLAGIDGRHLLREPNGKPLTCLDIASADTAAAMRALGVGCGQ
jgi:hypothetical protein